MEACLKGSAAVRVRLSADELFHAREQERYAKVVPRTTTRLEGTAHTTDNGDAGSDPPRMAPVSAGHSADFSLRRKLKFLRLNNHFSICTKNCSMDAVKESERSVANPGNAYENIHDWKTRAGDESVCGINGEGYVDAVSKCVTVRCWADTGAVEVKEDQELIDILRGK